MGLSIIIAAAGQGKRLYSESLETPKPLFFFKNKPIIAHILDFYKEKSDNIILVVSNNRLGQLLSSWLMVYYQNPSWLSIVTQPTPNGTNDVVKLAQPHIKYEKCLISWADFILDRKSFDESFDQDQESIFFTSDINCRFGIVDGKITQHKSNPGFIGVYYFKNFKAIQSEYEDFIENFVGQNVATKNISVISLGTINELVKEEAFKQTSNRFFNKVEFIDETVVKTPLTQQGIDLQKKEIDWYKSIPESLVKYVPKHKVENNCLILERINGKPLSESKLDSFFWRKKLPELLKSLHSPSDMVVNKADCYSTYIEKPKQRLSEVKLFIDKWFDGKQIINGNDFSNWEFPAIPDDLYPEKFTFIHGDLQFSNTMLTHDGDVKIIDPRGYFGSTKLYGDPAYDIAKILYAVDCYHKINEGNFSVHSSKNGTVLVHYPYEINSDILYFFDWACDTYHISYDKLNFLLFGIWLSLTSYIHDNPLAIIASYCKALMRSKYPILGKK
jgi:dTDP-glucose pyrophosphorylase